MPQQNDLSRSLIPIDQATTLVAVIELSQSSWLIAGTNPGIERQPLKKIAPAEAERLRVLNRWRDEAIRKGHTTTRIAVAFEAGRVGFWLARWLTGHGIDAHIIHSSSVAVSREHKRAKTDRLVPQPMRSAERAACRQPGTPGRDRACRAPLPRQAAWRRDRPVARRGSAGRFCPRPAR
jgi:hypothetical protein